MTLAKGDHVVKINPTTKEPVKGESHIEFEVLELSPYYYPNPEDLAQFVILKKTN